MKLWLAAPVYLGDAKLNQQSHFFESIFLYVYTYKG